MQVGAASATVDGEAVGASQGATATVSSNTDASISAGAAATVGAAAYFAADPKASQQTASGAAVFVGNVF